MPLPQTVEQLFNGDPKRWTTSYWAKDEHGHFCDEKSPEAVCWCLAGAIFLVHGNEAVTALAKVLKVIQAKYGEHHWSVPRWQDEVTFDDVMAVVREAGI